MNQTDYQVLLYYKYTDIQEPQKIMMWQRLLSEKLNLKGRILIASEGINGTVEGTTEATQSYINEVTKNPLFSDVIFKKSQSTGGAFPKLVVKVRDQIVSSKIVDDDIGPHRSYTGKYLTSKQLYQWLHPQETEEKKEFYIIDMRNDYEFTVGHFKNSILPKGLHNFRDLPKTLSSISHLKDKTIVTVCTGGVRCEIASGFLMKHGFTDVYQLKDGIVTYMEDYPNEDFLGKLYVFDQRVLIGFNLESPDHQIVGKCIKCSKTSENLVDHRESKVRKYEVVCPQCIVEGKVILD